MAHSNRTGTPHRAHGAMAMHVLDVMHGVLEASEMGRHVEPTTTCERPAPLPLGPAGLEVDC